MRDRCLGRDDHLAPILKRKIESATVIFRDDIPINVATLSSRVMFSVNSREPDGRIISHDRMTSPVGAFLPITTTRGLALLGLSEGQEFTIANSDRKDSANGSSRGLLPVEGGQAGEGGLGEDERSDFGQALLAFDQTRLLRSAHLVLVSRDGFDDPGPSPA